MHDTCGHHNHLSTNAREQQQGNADLRGSNGGQNDDDITVLEVEDNDTALEYPKEMSR